MAASPSTNEVLQWNDASSTPIEDVRAYSDTIHGLTGKRPNKLTMGREVWTQLVDHPDLVDRIKYSGSVGNTVPAMVSRMAVASILELDEVLVADGIQNTAAENPSFETSMSLAFCRMLLRLPRSCNRLPATRSRGLVLWAPVQWECA